jgi:DNA-binding NtrC family response regulator
MPGEHVSTVEFRSALRGQVPLELVVVEPQATYVLPIGREKQILVGRGSDADVRLSDDGVSDRHATITFGEALAVKDENSRNGTTVAGRRIGGQLVPLSVGEAIGVGSTILVVRKLPPVPRRKRVRSHHQFMAQLEDECDRALATQSGFAVLRLRSVFSREQLAARVSPHLTLTDYLGVYAGRDYQILLCPSNPAAAARRLDDLRRALPGCAIGMACFGQDGHRADQLVAAASDRLPQGASATSAPAPGQAVRASPVMKTLFDKAAVIAASGATSVLVLGETGTGKEVLARFLHDNSARASKPFFALDCGAIAPTLAEDLLFGHWKGAFFGADDDRAGILEAAQGGTVLLDEFQNLPLNLQALLLRALEQREVLRLGSGNRLPIPIDVRLVAAGSRDPADAVQSKEFRADLHYRISAFRLTIPPLRERLPDIVPLAQLFLQRFCAREGKDLALSQPAATLLESHTWPGNVRELRNIIERAVVLAPGPLVEPDDLDVPRAEADLEDDAGVAEESTPLDDLPPAQARKLVIDALIQSGCVKADAAQRLGLRSKTTLLKKMDALGLPRPKRLKDG